MERDEAERRAWDVFEPKLASLQHFHEAQLPVSQGPRPNSPGRGYYSNLGFFLQDFTVPAGSSREERLLYIEFVKRLDAAGELKEGSAEEILDRLKESLVAG